MPKTIMIVDDEPDIRSTVKTILEKEGYKVVTAVDGDDCLKKLPKQKVDLILLDVMMPGTPVVEVTKRIKGVKIIYLTALRTSEDEKKELLKSPNVVDFIQKPFDIDNLIEEVKKVIKKRLKK